MAYSSFDEKPSLSDIQHYGRLGMKWGKRIFGEEKAYDRAGKKLEKLDKKAVKAANKASIKEAKSVRKQMEADSAILFKNAKGRSAARAIDKSSRARSDYVRKMAKASSWYKAMEANFRDKPVTSLNSRYRELGKKYAKLQINDMMANAQTSVANKQLISYYRNRRR